jgi:GrpB-like predicted nucleotidyltransferase (UPF0157 family)
MLILKGLLWKSFCFAIITLMTEPIKYTTNHKYELVDYSTDWPEWFIIESSIIKDIVGDVALGIQHVGSTAIPGMKAKPQLDILMTVKNISDIDAYNEPMKKAGYEVYGDILDKGGRLFSRWNGGTKTVNLHVYQPDSPIVLEYIAVRDYLLANPDEALKYSAFKTDLYNKYPNDYLKYREHKDPYMISLQERIESLS